jgi:transcription elongation factor Elf1
MDLVDSKFIGLISPRLQKFKKIKSDLYNFRCPICGDSQKNKSKTRGYLYGVKADVNFRCHNCGASMTFSNFLKTLDPVIHKQYVFERFKNNKTGRGTVVEEPKFDFKPPQFAPKVDLPRASENDAARLYLEKRLIDPKIFNYTPTFKKWVNTLVPNKFSDITYDEPRIIIPLIYENQLIGFQGRALGPNSVKYITIMLDDDAPKIYGLDKINNEFPVFVTEGPFDSTFVSNSIAMCGADGDVRKWGISDPVWVYDNEPRSHEIVKRISSTIDRGEKVVIWPNNINEKDINDMILAGHDVMGVLNSNTYSGLTAQLQFNTWKRI